jgi:hypothetical protein
LVIEFGNEKLCLKDTSKQFGESDGNGENVLHLANSTKVAASPLYCEVGLWMQWASLLASPYWLYVDALVNLNASRKTIGECFTNPIEESLET